MSIYARLLGIAAVVSGLGLPEALLAGDVWKGSWKFEFDRFDRPHDRSNRRDYGRMTALGD